jgi:hypothetical protein
MVLSATRKKGKIKINSRMNTDKLIFNGAEYIIRDVYLSDYKVTVKVSTDELDHEVFDQDSGYTSREAELIDELIFCYVPETLINAGDAELEEYIIDKVYGS